MSSIMVCNSVLVNANTEVLKKTLEIIAQEEGIRVSGSVKSYYGASHTSWDGNEILGALVTNELSRGIGVAIDKNGKLVFVGDPYRCESAFNKMKDRIEFTYKKVALILAMQQIGCDVTVLRDSQEIVVLEGTFQ